MSLVDSMDRITSRVIVHSEISDEHACTYVQWSQPSKEDTIETRVFVCYIEVFATEGVMFIFS